MKSKFLTRLLTGALFAASVSSFVSCKDYDDEINNLQNQINKAALQEDLNSLSSTLTTSIRNAKAAADAAQETAEDAFSAAMLANANAEGRVSQAQFDAAVAEIKAAADALGQKQAQDIEAVTKAAQEAYANAQQATSKADSVAHKAEADAAAAKVAAANAQKAADDAAAAVTLLASQVQEGFATKAQLEEAKAAAQRAADAAAAQAKEAADAAEKAAKAYADLKAASTLGDAKSYADGKAAEAADEAKRYAADAISKALSTYDEAATAERNTAIAAAIAKALEGTNLEQVPSDLQEQLEKLSKMQEEMAKNTELLESVDTLKQQLSTLNEETIKPMKEAIDKLKIQVADLYQAVTSVELVGTALRKAPGVITINQAPYNYDLDFLFGQVSEDSWFGDNEDAYSKAVNPHHYVKGQPFNTDYNLLIRVSPVTADLAKESVKISLLDSWKRDLSEIIEIGEPKPYKNLITTRAQTDIETGLWVIPVKVKEKLGVSKEQKKKDFNRQVYDGGDWNENGDIVGGKQIAYAVVVMNTEQDEKRYAISSYDITTRYIDYVPANWFTVKLNEEKNLEDLKNRWDLSYNNQSSAMEDGIEGEDSRAKSFDNPELTWAVPGKPYTAKTATNVMEAGKNALYPFDDRRRNTVPYNYPNKTDFLHVDVNETFTLNILDTKPRRYYVNNNTVSPRYTRYENTTVEYYYVTLDLGNAIESNPSERNAWRDAYNIQGIDTLVLATDVLTMSINSESAAGDVIGFRVYAVNYDGTLVDPDGRAFYVKVNGDKAVEVDATVQARATKYDYRAITSAEYNVGTGNVTKTFTNLPISAGTSSATDETKNLGVSGLSYGATGRAVVYGDFYKGSASTPNYEPVSVYWELLDKDNNLATNWADIKKVKVCYDHPEYLIDNSSKLFTIYGHNINASNEPIVNQLTVELVKAMPITADIPEDEKLEDRWVSSLGPRRGASSSFTSFVYPDPQMATGNSDAWLVNNLYSRTAQYGYYSFANDEKFRLAVGLASNDNGGSLYQFEIANATEMEEDGYTLTIPADRPSRPRKSFTHTYQDGQPRPSQLFSYISSYNPIDLADARYYRSDDDAWYTVTASGQGTLVGPQTSRVTYASDYDLYIPSSKIDNASHAITGYYWFKDISLDTDNYSRFVRKNYRVVAQNFYLRIDDIQQRFKRYRNWYVVTPATATDPAVNDTTYYIRYSQNNVTQLYRRTKADAKATPVYTTSITDITTSMQANADARAQELYKFWTETNGYNGGVEELLTSFNINRIFDYKVTLTGEAASIYDWDNPYSTTVSLTKKNTLTPDKNEVPGTITLKGYDVYGKEVIATVHVVVLKNL